MVKAEHKGCPYGNAVFMKFHVVNKSNYKWQNAYLTLWNDPDMGDPSDDMAGVDVDRGLGFVYNGLEQDNVYGSNPPAVGFDVTRLLKDKPDLGKHFEPAMERLTSKKSKIKTALEKALQPTNKKG